MHRKIINQVFKGSIIQADSKTKKMIPNTIFSNCKEQIVTRFPPEPSGYLHIGHAKAAINNYFYSKFNGGKFILRIDDTNPLKESKIYADAIIKDTLWMGIKPDKITYTSDHFGKMLEHCETLIKQGNAYADDNKAKIISEDRSNHKMPLRSIESISTNLHHWNEMKKGYSDYCIRAKFGNNSCAYWDPVIYRVITMPHFKLGDAYKVYPTYDFSCPISDHYDGVTLTGRTNEFAPRDQLYKWILSTLKLRDINTYYFSRMHMIFSILSKRLLTELVKTQKIEWNDPRMPTIQGLARRGILPEALQEFMIEVGITKTAMQYMEWDKLYSINRDYIDPIAKRFTAISSKAKYRIKIVNFNGLPLQGNFRCHPITDLGSKTINYSDEIIIEDEDAQSLKSAKKFTLLRWGNFKIIKNVENIIYAEYTPHDTVYSGTFKISWLPNTSNLLPATLIEYGHLLNTKCPESNHFDRKLINNRSKVSTSMLCEPIMGTLRTGDTIQLERRGFCKVENDGELLLHYIPNGKCKSMSCIPNAFNQGFLMKGIAS